MRRVHWFTFCLLIALGMGVAACSGQVCTLIACGNGLTIDFSQVDSSTWQDGDWNLRMTTPSGEYASCDFQLPATDEDISGSSCTGPLNLEFSSDGTRLVEASSWRSSADEVPRDFEITLQRGGSEVASQSFNPEYSESRPNGEGCPPVCVQGSVEFSG